MELSGSQVMCTFTLNNTGQLHYMTVTVGREHCLLRNEYNNSCRLWSRSCQEKLKRCGLLERYEVEGNDSVAVKILTFNSTVDGENICCLVSSPRREPECITFPLDSKY